MAKTFGFMEHTARILKRQAGTGVGDVPQLPPGMVLPPPAIIAKTPSGGIPARSGSVVSSAVCTVYAINDGSLASASEDVSVYNISPSAVAGNTYILLTFAGGVLVAMNGFQVLDIRINGAVFQYTKNGSDWIDWHTGTECGTE